MRTHPNDGDSLDVSLVRSSMLSLLESQPEPRLARRRSLSMFQNSEMESIKHFHEREAQIAVDEKYHDSLSNDCNDNDDDNAITVSLDDDSLLESQPEPRPARRRSLSMFQNNEMELIKQFHERKAQIAVDEKYHDSLSNGSSDNDDDNAVTVSLDDDSNDELTVGSLGSCPGPRSTITSTDSYDEQSNASSTSPSPSILKSTLSTRHQRDLTTTFSTLEIREYKITLGDNPGGAQGPPISLDWKYSKRRTQVIALEEYEEMRPPRRRKAQLRMTNSIHRWTRLREEGFSLRDIDKATKAAESIRIHRRKSIRYPRIPRLKKKLGRIIGSIKS